MCSSVEGPSFFPYKTLGGNMKEKKLAEASENFVTELLIQADWTILARNYRCLGSEIDIISFKGKMISFVEVKYRKVFQQTDVELSSMLTRQKKQALQRGALNFLQEKNAEIPKWNTLRFDLAVVYPNKRSARKEITYYSNVI